ncbi:hypothetical protein [Furfurilactobacillus curtus]|uniref:Uncharacterized protein n=1 Tax=Furfurilactobacillus curtus TaxID=1746200 RepID=A0ABQ5JS51_9LACO
MENKSRSGFILPSSIFLMVLAVGLILLHIHAYEASAQALRSNIYYWQIQTITNEVNEVHYYRPEQKTFVFKNGRATLTNSQISIVLNGGQTASRQVWQRKQALK